MESNRLIIVPKNQAGIDKYNRGENDETDSIIFRLSGKEFVTLQRHRVFDILNDRFDLWIDDGESELSGVHISDDRAVRHPTDEPKKTTHPPFPR